MRTAQYLVIDSNSQDVHGHEPMYRRLNLAGSTHTEAELRKWACRIWRVPEDAPLGLLAKVATNKGWLVYRLVEPVPGGEEEEGGATDGSANPIGTEGGRGRL
jgi:hypothetical protein